MEAETKSGRLSTIAAHPLAELLECPPETGKLLNGTAACTVCEAGDVVFRQETECKGLYVLVSGQFVRSTERMKARLTLGPARAGELVELAAALGDGHHTYTLRALTQGTILLLTKESLQLAFESYPPLRMRLLEELAREVSRAYISCSLTRKTPARRQSAGANPG